MMMMMVVGGRVGLMKYGCCLFEELMAFSNVRRVVFLVGGFELDSSGCCNEVGDGLTMDC